MMGGNKLLMLLKSSKSRKRNGKGEAKAKEQFLLLSQCEQSVPYLQAVHISYKEF